MWLPEEGWYKMAKVTNYDELYGNDVSDADYSEWLKNEGEKDTKKAKPGTSDGGYMSGIASIGNALNDTSDFWWKVINSDKTQKDQEKALAMQQDSLALAKTNATAGRRSTEREQDMSGLSYLAAQRASAQKNANLAGFRNSLFNGVA